MNKKDEKAFPRIKGAVRDMETGTQYTKESFRNYLQERNIDVVNMEPVIQELMKRGYVERLGSESLIRTDKC